MTENIDIFLVNPISFETQTYALDDDKLIASTIIDESFSSGVDYVEYTVFNLNQEPVAYLPILNDYKIIDNKLNIEPGNNIKSLGFTDGQYYSLYNFLTNKLGSSPDNTYYISEISSDRTELRLDSLNINNETIITSTSDLINELNTSEYYLDFYLNFGLNKLIIANNVLLDTSDSNNPTVLIKLYEPLPAEFDVKSELWIVDKIAESVAYQINLQTIFQYVDNNVKLKGPNFNLGLNDKTNNSTDYVNFASSTTSSYQLGTGSFYSQINNLLSQKGININIDYSSYSNFVHFSSAETRLENFYYKMSLLETYQKSARSGSNTTNTFTSGSTAYYNGLINDLISNFDGYEYYLYYNSSSTTWPKTNSTPPYINASVATVSTWFNNQLTTAITYDQQNKDALVYSIPQYLYDDPTNSQFELFIEMIGQHFDTIYNYTKDITNKYNADNRLDYGVSKDLIADILRDFGLKIYQNNFSTQNLYSAFLGITPSGSLFNIPGTTTTLPAASGLEYIKTFVTASSTSSLVPLDDANKEIYKRLYHNLPYLLKKKGTTAGLRTLINTYGIPDTILRINEFGGKDKNNTQDWDNWQNTFNYAVQARELLVTSSARLADDGYIPNTIMLRFKTPDLAGLDWGSTLRYGILFGGQAAVTSDASALVLEYTGSGFSSASYSGSTLDPYYQYATLKWIPNIASPLRSASLYLPFFNQDWWSVMLNFSSGSADRFEYFLTSSLFAKQKGEYQGDNYILYQASSSVTQSSTVGTSWSTIYLNPPTFAIDGTDYPSFSDAQYQELRYYNTKISESVFNDTVMNPLSIEGNQLSGSQSSYTSLRFRAPLGTDLKTYVGADSTLTSIHPSVTGSYVGVPTSSFTNGSSTYALYDPIFITSSEYIYQDQPNAGIKIPISDKVKIGSQILPTGDTLSPYISIQQDLPISSSYTKDVNYVEVGFSPQDEINDDIQEQFGFFNYGEYIGDPRFQSSSATSYPDLNKLRDYYFQKYYKNNNIFDYVRLIKYFDNSLFKMIQDFVPARTDLATGVIIKQHILERNRYRSPQVDWEDNQYTGSVTSLSSGYATGSKIYTFTGSTGGTVPYLLSTTSSGYYPPFINISQSWSEVVQTPSGSLIKVHDNLEEFYNGEFEGTTIVATTQSLIDEDCQQFLDVNTTEVQYKPILYLYSGSAPISQSVFLSSDVTPSAGEILLYFISEQVQQGSPDGQQSQRPNQSQNTQ